MDNKKSSEWSNRLGFIFAALGMAVGTGNIWRFPRIVGQNYGGTFLIAYFVCNMLWVLPLLITEMGIGKSARLGTIGAFGDFINKKHSYFGSIIAWVCAAITFYYAVVFGQSIRYFVFSVEGKLTADMDAQLLWNQYNSNPLQTILFTLIACLLMGFIIYNGVNNGLEKLGKIAVPILFISLMIVGVWTIQLDGAIKGLEYLFIPNFKYILDKDVWLNALTQAAWSAGAGWGMMLTYANYFKKKEDIVVNSAMITFGDMTGAILGAFAVLPAVFALSANETAGMEALKSGNVGLTFITLASLFPKIPGGRILASIFFLALSLAALTSIVPQAEVVTKNLENLGVDRKKASVIFTIVTFILSIPSAVSPDFLSNQDWVYGIGLLICGIFYAIAVYKYGVDRFRNEVVNPDSDYKIGKFYNFAIFLFPFMLIAVVGYNSISSYIANPSDFFNIFSTSSIGTVIAQLLVIFLIFKILNDKLYDSIVSTHIMKNGSFIKEGKL